MSSPIERVVNLALFLASARTPVSAERIRADVFGYPHGQDEATFLRMFERDKEDLRAAGLAITTTADGAYALDAARSFCAEFTLAPAEEFDIRAVGAALLDDPSFPFADDLRSALLKIASASDSPAPVAARIADERPASQGAAVALLASALADRKRVSIKYTNASGRRSERAVEPYGLFVRGGRWYLVGRDTGSDEVRVFTVARMRNAVPNHARPKSPDFETPAGFDVGPFIGLPFQYGPSEPFEVTILFAAAAAWRASALAGDVGTLEPADDGAVLWHVTARDEAALLRWIIAHGPGIEVRAPDRLVRAAESGLTRVVALHG